MNNEVFNNNIFKLVDNCEPNKDKNIIVSGLSIKMALAMLLNGAEGQSKEELEAFFGVNKQELNEDTLRSFLECRDSNIMLANAFWFSEPNQVNEEFSQIIKKYQNAEINVDDFDSRETLIKINDWVRSNTNGLVNNALSKLSSEITSLLINTLYFNGKWWPKGFDKYLTKDEKFYGLNKTRKVKTMRRDTTRYFENEYAKGFSLGYKECPYEFIAVLPNKEGEFKLEELDLNNFNKKEGYYTVYLTFPRLNIEFSTELSEEFKAMGMIAPFSNAEDFGSMLSIPQIVHKVIHKTIFKLDEDGTEAAAITAVEMLRGAASPGQPIELKFNRPFAFMIRHRDTKELLFVGKINNLK